MSGLMSTTFVIIILFSTYDHVHLHHAYPRIPLRQSGDITDNAHIIDRPMDSGDAGCGCEVWGGHMCRRVTTDVQVTMVNGTEPTVDVHATARSADVNDPSHG